MKNKSICLYCAEFFLSEGFVYRDIYHGGREKGQYHDGCFRPFHPTVARFTFKYTKRLKEHFIRCARLNYKPQLLGKKKQSLSLSKATAYKQISFAFSFNSWLKPEGPVFDPPGHLMMWMTSPCNSEQSTSSGLALWSYTRTVWLYIAYCFSGRLLCRPGQSSFAQHWWGRLR